MDAQGTKKKQHGDELQFPRVGDVVWTVSVHHTHRIFLGDELFQAVVTDRLDNWFGLDIGGQMGELSRYTEEVGITWWRERPHWPSKKDERDLSRDKISSSAGESNSLTAAARIEILESAYRRLCEETSQQVAKLLVERDAALADFQALQKKHTELEDLAGARKNRCSHLENEIATANERANEVYKLWKRVSEERDSAYLGLGKISKAVGESADHTPLAIADKIRLMRSRLKYKVAEVERLKGELSERVSVLEKMSRDRDAELKKLADQASPGGHP